MSMMMTEPPDPGSRSVKCGVSAAGMQRRHKEKQHAHKLGLPSTLSTHSVMHLFGYAERPRHAREVAQRMQVAQGLEAVAIV